MSTNRTAVVTGASSGVGRATVTAVRRLWRELRSSSLGHTEWQEPLPEVGVILAPAAPEHAIETDWLPVATNRQLRERRRACRLPVETALTPQPAAPPRAAGWRWSRSGPASVEAVDRPSAAAPLALELLVGASPDDEGRRRSH